MFLTSKNIIALHLSQFVSGSYGDDVAEEALRRRCNKYVEYGACYTFPPELGKSEALEDNRRKEVEKSIRKVQQRKLRSKETPDAEKKRDESNKHSPHISRASKTPDAKRQQNKTDK